MAHCFVLKFILRVLWLNYTFRHRNGPVVFSYMQTYVGFCLTEWNRELDVLLRQVTSSLRQDRLRKFASGTRRVEVKWTAEVCYQSLFSRWVNPTGIRETVAHVAHLFPKGQQWILGWQKVDVKWLPCCFGWLAVDNELLWIVGQSASATPANVSFAFLLSLTCLRALATWDGCLALCLLDILLTQNCHNGERTQ